MANFEDDGSGAGVYAHSDAGNGVHGVSDRHVGVRGTQQAPSGIDSPVGTGVLGESRDGVGVFGASAGRFGVHGVQQELSGIAAPTGAGVAGDAKDGVGVFGTSAGRFGVHGVQQELSGLRSPAGAGVAGESGNGIGVWAASAHGEGLHAESRSTTVAALAAFSLNPEATTAAIYAETKGKGPAAIFRGKVECTDVSCRDVFVTGADVAEDFELADATGVDPGTVVVLDGVDRVQTSDRPYDRRVAGVVSGAGDYRPGIVLDRGNGNGSTGRRPVALVGKVACKVDAGYGPIEVGDLLVTSPTPGHAMRAGDGDRSAGAILGKAMAALASGTGHLPILVTLQ